MKMETKSTTSSRRALLVGALGAAVASIASAVGRPTPATATQDSPVIAGQSNSATWSTIVTTNAGAGLQGESSAEDGFGVFGTATGTSGMNFGVAGDSAGPFGRGVVGWAKHASGNTHGVSGQSDSTSGRGVYGYAPATSGTTFGVMGQADSTSGFGLAGLAPADSGTTRGVYGWAKSSSGTGVIGYSGTNIAGPAPIPKTGVYGYADLDAASIGVRGSSPSGTGVAGATTGSTGIGVHGTANNLLGSTRGVRGEASAGTFNQGGHAIGVEGVATGGSTYGVRGHATTGVAGFTGISLGSGEYWGPGAGVAGFSGVADVDRPGVYGMGPLRGVHGRAYGSGPEAVGIFGQHDGNGKGVVGMSAGGSMPSDLQAAGVVGYGWGTPGVYARSELTEAFYGESNSSSPAARFYSWGDGVGMAAGSGGGPPTRDKTGIVGYAGQDAQSVGVWGESYSGEGIHGRAPSGVGMVGESESSTGTVGLSESQTGVLGFSGTTADFEPAGVSKTGVYGIAVQDSASRGVHGYSPVGLGVSGRSDTGTAGSFATPTASGVHTGTALVADGRVKFPNCVGVALIAPGAKSVVVTPGIDLTSSSAVVATLMGSAGGTTSVHRVAVNATTNTLTIHLTANSTAATNVKVAWHVFG